MTTIVTTLNTPPAIEVSFAWTPAGTITVLGTSAPSATVNTPLTFTAATVIDDPTGLLSVIEYRWDFGDGIIGYGSPVAHTYTLANPFIITVLRVTDSSGHQWFTRAPMYLA